jgi:hypothetical protein
VLRTVLQVARTALVHCCAPGVPIALLRRAGAAGISLDAGLLTRADDQQVGEAVEAGTRLLLGLVPATDQAGTAPLGDDRAVLAPALALWRRLGLDPALLPAQVLVTPTCGLAGAAPGHVRAALEACVRAGEHLSDLD